LTSKVRSSQREAVLLARARRFLPEAASTLAKSPNRFFPPLTPSFAVSGHGPMFIDSRGQRWLDCDMGLGTVVWGYCRAEIDDAAIEQIRRGAHFSVPTAIEAELAEKVIHRLTSFEAVRFCKNGSDAVTAAVRIARSATGRTRVVSGSYHGWHDWSAYRHYGGGPELGIPAPIGQLTLWLEDETVECATATVESGTDVAALIVCPEHWAPAGLRSLRLLCDEKGIVLVFDEVKSSIRFGRHGVCGGTGVVPDLLCLGKGLANGYPLAGIVGPHDLMRRCTDVRFTGTFFGECVSLAAASAAEDLLANHESWPPWRPMAEAMMDRIQRTIVREGLTENLSITGYHGCFRIQTPNLSPLADPFRHYFVQELAKRGIFSAGHVLLSCAHDERQVAQIRDACQEVVSNWARKPA
jgi:glutamate-1-semialdehyde 2,1-aminomutase